ncbi:alveolar macrophage chemotactic factor-like [Polymixia lowei]
MSPRPLALFGLLIICCVVTTHGLTIRDRCLCIQTSPRLISLQLIKKLEVRPAGASCRQVEIIITKKNGSTVCVDPEAPWINKVIDKLLHDLRSNRRRST